MVDVKEREPEAIVEALAAGDEVIERLREVTRLIAELLDEQKTLISNLGEQRNQMVHQTKAFSPEQWEAFAKDFMDGGGVIARAKKSARLADGWMVLADVIETTGATKRTIYRWMDDKGFPRPEKLRGLARWKKDAVEAWWNENKDRLGRWPSV